VAKKWSENGRKEEKAGTRDKEKKEMERIKHPRNKFLVTALHPLNLNPGDDTISAQRRYEHFALLSKTQRQRLCRSFYVKATRSIK